MKFKLITPLSFLLTATLALFTSIHTPKVTAQPATFNVDNLLKCAEYCRQLPTDYKYRKLKITQKLINQLPKWNNICQKLTGKGLCAVAKSYQFKDGLIYLKIQGTESFSTDIKFNSGISSQQAVNIAKQSFNNGESFPKTERLKNRTVLYSNPIDNGGETFYLQETYLILNSRNQVNRIVSVSTTP
ncbi:MAG: hypothetical protein RLZZ507_2670 [Cyanobacteriota bacterium]|jgi:hypothetical protein